MSKRLIKIAKELNVGTSTIVEFLSSKGFEVPNRPTSKVSDEMYGALVKEFSSSMAVKEKANALVIGHRPEEEKPVLKAEIPVIKTVVEKPVVVAPTPEAKVEPIVPPAPTEKPKEVVTPAATITPVKAPTPVTIKAEGPKLKVMGKIDLDADKKKLELKREEAKKLREKANPGVKEADRPKIVEPVAQKVEKVVKPAEVAKPKAVKKTDKVEQKSKPAAAAPVIKKEPAKKADAKTDVKEPAQAPADKAKKPSAPAQVITRAKTPKLKGLKIMGKIDTQQFEKKPKADAKKAEEKKAAERKKRTRKKVTAQSNFRRNKPKPGAARGGAAAGRKGKDEVKAISQKEIQDKIKATMARLSGGGKNKRQKIRRDNRADKREVREQIEIENVETTLKVTEFISASELASLMDVSVAEIITKCMNLGVIISINQRLDAEIIELVAEEFGNTVEFIGLEDQDKEEEIEEVDDPADLVPRAPIVTVMGHVDHGKTSLLDHIRKANVASGEAGGITQHVGAYSVKVGKRMITFLDTPGHEAFTAMRARGAKVTDIVIVIVAADDKIMPQTKEAISHAQAAGVPIIFAVNKIDKDGADPTRIRQGLAEMNILTEDWGGKFQVQDISAKTGLNIDLLLEKIILEADMLELKANPNKNAIGTVVEASLDKGRGYVTKLLVQAGTLKIGDSILCGAYSGKVKAMFNDKGSKIKGAGPAIPVAILGLDGAPQAGEKFRVLDKDQDAKGQATKRAQIEREQSNRANRRISLDEIGRRLALGTFKELNLIVKGDVDGSIEALSDSLIKLSQETVQVNVIHKAVGQVVESDVLLASASDAIVIGFQVRPSSGARNLAEKEGVQIKTYSIIYEVIDEVKKAIIGMLDTIKEEKVLGTIEIKETYKISKIGTIAGCLVNEGKILADAKIRLIRNGIVVFPTKEGIVAELGSLKRYKDDVKEVRAGMECGLTVKNYNDIKSGDIIEAYEIIEIKRKLI